MNDETKISLISVFVFVILISILIFYGWMKSRIENSREDELRREHDKIVWMLSRMEDVINLKGGATSIVKCKAFKKMDFLGYYEDFRVRYNISDEMMEEMFDGYRHVIVRAKECDEKMREYENVSEAKMSELTYLLTSIMNLNEDLEDIVEKVDSEKSLYNKAVMENHLCLQISSSGVKRLYDDYVRRYGEGDKLMEYEIEEHDVSDTLWEHIKSGLSCIVDMKGVALVGSMSRKIDRVHDDIVGSLGDDEMLRGVLSRYGLLDQMKEYKRTYRESLMFEYMLLKMDVKSEDIIRIIDMA